MKTVPHTKFPAMCYELRKDFELCKYVWFLNSTDYTAIYLMRKFNVKSLMGIYITWCWKFRGYAVFPLFLDVVYNRIYRSLRKLVRGGILTRVRCEPIEYDYVKANSILAKTEGYIAYNNVKVPVRKLSITNVPSVVLLYLLNNYLIPKKGHWRIKSIYRHLGILKKVGSKYCLTPEGVKEVINELSRRMVSAIDRISKKALLIAYDLGYINDPSAVFLKSTRIVSSARMVEGILMSAEKLQKSNVKFKELNDLVDVYYTTINLVDDWWLNKIAKLGD